MGEAYGTIKSQQVNGTLEANQEAFEKDLSARFVQAEIRHRRIAQQDIQAALRGLLNDVVSNVESRVEGLISKEVTKQLRPYLEVHERSQQQVKDLVDRSQQRVKDLVDANSETLKADRVAFTKSIEDVVAEIVFKLLKEYWVLDSEGRVLDANQRPVSGISRRD